MVRRLVFGVVLAFIALGMSRADVRATHRDGAEVVIEWNQLLQAHIPATTGLMSPRQYAMLHIAMFDAINSVEEEYTPYLVRGSETM